MLIGNFYQTLTIDSTCTSLHCSSISDTVIRVVVDMVSAAEPAQAVATAAATKAVVAAAATIPQDNLGYTIFSD